MFKKIVFLGVSCLLSLSLSLPVFAQSVPEDIESAITQDLKKSEKQISEIQFCINMKYTISKILLTKSKLPKQKECRKLLNSIRMSLYLAGGPG
ncbi:hypothetical protein [Paenibacillus medicaginis]|uniref:Uncharacterized protein n=1 Tax=Paenibacillus medicaginis TaxID=1470560 RepID=A0ABV5C1G7_9BACL